MVFSLHNIMECLIFCTVTLKFYHFEDFHEIKLKLYRGESLEFFYVSFQTLKSVFYFFKN